VTTKKKNEALKAAFKNTKAAVKPAVVPINGRRRKQESGNVLIGANFPPHVRKTLAHIELDTDRNMKSLLGEASPSPTAKARMSNGDD
jgi:hypothetical protein